MKKIYQVSKNDYPEDADVLYTTESEIDAKRYKKIFEPMYKEGLSINPVGIDPMEDIYGDVVISVSLYKMDDCPWNKQLSNRWIESLDQVNTKKAFQSPILEGKITFETYHDTEYWAYVVMDSDEWIEKNKEVFLNELIDSFIEHFDLDRDDVIENLLIE